MKKYLITVNGNKYEVEVEELTARSNEGIKQVQEAAKPEPNEDKTTQITPPQAVVVTKGSEMISSPMPGIILKIAVTAGQEIKKGQLLCILEAMKMENEIVSPRDAKIAGVIVAKGASVNAGDPLISFE